MTDGAPQTPWILLRGLMRETRHWGDFPHILSTRLPHAGIITLDLPGNGSLYRQRSPDTIGEMTHACRAQLEARNIRPPYHLLALSLGAMVAVDWAVRHPHDIGRAVLINTSLRPFSPFFERLRPRTYPALLRLLLSTPDTVRRERTILALTSNLHPPSSLLSEWMRYARECPVTRANVMRQLVAALRYDAPQQRPGVALLILSSRQDHLVHPRCSARLARQWQVPLRTHDTAGHDLPLDAPEWAAQHICDWIGA